MALPPGAGTFPTDVYTIDWPELPPGVHQIKAAATDQAGLKGVSEPTVITIKNPTNVIAFDDSYVVLESSPAVALCVLSNDASSSFPPLHITQVLQPHQNLGRVTIGHDGSYLTYTPLPHTYGTDVFAYTVTNAAGATDSAWVTVNIRARPVANIDSPQDEDHFAVGTSINLHASATDWDGQVTNISFHLNCTNRLAQSPTNALSIAWSNSNAGFYSFTAVAIDSHGISATSGPVTIALTDTNTATNPLTASIDNLTPTVISIAGVMVSNWPVVSNGLFAVLGNADDPVQTDLVSYQLLLCRPEDNQYLEEGQEPVSYANVTPKPLNSSGFREGRATNSLGSVDLTAVPNGTYDLYLTVRGGGGQTNTSARFRLESQLKIGQFSFSEQDLVIPVNGIPLTVTRTYNSLNPRSADFGCSWTYSLMGMDIQLDDERQDVAIGTPQAPLADDEEDDNKLPRVVSIRTGGGRDVTLTLPDGRRTTFAFTPRPGNVNAYAEWTPPSGVHAKLTPLGSQYIDYFPLPLHWRDGGDNSSFENHDVPGWILETKDGTQYRIERGKGNRVQYSPNGDANYINVLAYGTPRLTNIVQRSGDSIQIRA